MPDRSATPVRSLLLEQHLRCARCGYDLYLLSEDGSCPECFTAVQFTVDTARKAAEGGLEALHSLRRILLVAAVFPPVAAFGVLCGIVLMDPYAVLLILLTLVCSFILSAAVLNDGFAIWPHRHRSRTWTIVRRSLFVPAMPFLVVGLPWVFALGSADMLRRAARAYADGAWQKMATWAVGSCFVGVSASIIWFGSLAFGITGPTVFSVAYARKVFVVAGFVPAILQCCSLLAVRRLVR